jgi:prepilin-type processing-associated H-X9-DG protein
VNHGWAPFILPFIERKDLFDRYQWDLWSADAGNQPVLATHVKTFQCPSAPYQDRFMTFGAFADNGRGACGDYAAVFSVDAVLVHQGLIAPPDDYQGVLAPNQLTRWSWISDGASNTILLTEDAGRPQLWQSGRAGPDQTVLGGPWAAYNNGIILAGSGRDGTGDWGPCAINCSNNREVYSFHPRGANAVFVDGSVRFLHADLPIQVVAALATRAGGESVSLGDF